jgi:solute carrier family 25 iron transporter 28/37
MDNSKVSSPPPSIAGGDYEVDYEALPTSSIYVNLFAGALAGITEHTVMYPIDCKLACIGLIHVAIKTRMQVLHPNPSAIYSGVLNAISKISSTEGVTALWRGMNSVVVGAGIKLILTYTGPSHALYFATYEYCKANYPQNYLGIAAAGASATIMADGFMNPFDGIPY